MRVLRCINCKRKRYLYDEEGTKCPYCKSTFVQLYENEVIVNQEEVINLNKTEDIKEVTVFMATKKELKQELANELIALLDEKKIEVKDAIGALRFAVKIAKKRKKEQQ